MGETFLQSVQSHSLSISHPNSSLKIIVTVLSAMRGHVITSRTAFTIDKIFDFKLEGLKFTSGEFVLHPYLARKRSSFNTAMAFRKRREDK
mmetsp:Transcript_48171/g.151134  ORF Transcript_48171/g.151134 Transcript_48171/m.151134 type:complete len:91 (+) Transcript_48171:1581-1853(+)